LHENGQKAFSLRVAVPQTPTMGSDPGPPDSRYRLALRTHDGQSPWQILDPPLQHSAIL